MKKYFFYLLLSCCISLTGLAQDPDFVIPKNEVVTLEAEDGTLIVARDIYSQKSKLKRSVQLFDPKTNTMIGEAIIRLEGSNPDENMYDILQNEPDRFSGVLIIESEGKIIYSNQIVDGKALGGQTEDGVPVANLSGRSSPGSGLPCNIRTIHNCVSHVIEGMNWFQFGLCLLRAPACYAQQWVYCSWQVCVNHIQYPN